MKKLVACFILLSMLSSVLVPVGIGYTQSGACLTIAAGAYDIPEFSFTINPCKYTYDGWGMATVQTTITELSGKSGQFDLGDGNIVTIPAHGNLTHAYKFNYLHGQTERIYITRLATQSSGITFQEQLVLKIQTEGGDER